MNIFNLKSIIMAKVKGVEPKTKVNSNKKPLMKKRPRIGVHHYGNIGREEEE